MDDLSLQFRRLQAGEGCDDVYALYARMREEAPFLELDYGDYGRYIVVTRHRAVSQLYRDPAHFVNNTHVASVPAFKSWREQTGPWSEEDECKESDLASFTDRSMPFTPQRPDHARKRKVFGRALNARVVRDFEPAVQEIVDRTLRELAEAEDPDAVTWIGHTIPRRTLLRLLDLPERDDALVSRFVNTAEAYPRLGTMEEMRASHASLEEFRSYVANAIDRRRHASERVPFVSTLIDAIDAGEIMLDELVAMYRTVLRNGAEGSRALLTTGLHTLLRHPDEFARLRERPDLIPAAVDECLRFDSPVQGTGRTAGVDAVLDGRVIRRGERVIAMIASANRDESVFVHADRFDMERADGRRRLSFAPGVHTCLGRRLGRLQARVLFGTLARRYPEIQLAEETVRWRPDPMSRVPARMRVALGREVRPPV